jgi:N-acetyl-gamma-glutamyl-phosphate reductase
MKIGIVGATGYAGAEVLRLAGQHPELTVVIATGDSNAGKRVADHVPGLAALYPDMTFAATEEILSSDVEVAFIALPHGHSQGIVPQLLDRGVRIFDLGADFRLKSKEDYETWYGSSHSAPALLSRSVYGLVERHRQELTGANLVAVPGCYPTATSLALGPFLDQDIVATEGIVVNALSGASGAGRSLSDRLHFSRLSGNAEAYGLLHHRHTIEIQQEIKAEIIFTPHLVPVARGMLVTAYAKTKTNIDTSKAQSLLRSTYANDPFVVVTDEPPTLKDPVGSNLCFISARVDSRTGWLVVMSSIDNLIKGAAGQALQALNVSMGWSEISGLPLSGVTP